MATSKGGYVSGGFDILKAPNAPTITSVTTGIGSASVAFTAPANVGGGAITSYTITAVDESTGASTGAVGSASPITVSPPAGGTFKIRAAATNIYGPGRVSQYDTGNLIYGGAELEVWGSNSSGQLGDGTVISRSSPVQVGALTNWASLGAGDNHSLAVKTNNTLWTWGYNTFGQLGQGNSSNSSSPTQVGALTNWYQAEGGSSNSVAIKTDGTLWSWGRNTDGQLGQNVSFSVNRSSPVQVGALTDWYQVSAGQDHCAAIKTDGTMWTWGLNSSGQLADGTRVSRSSPVQVGVLTNWLKVSVGGGNCSALKTDGTLWTWGSNSFGELGQNNVIYRSSPVQVGALTTWASTEAGSGFCFGVSVSGSFWSWGGNTDGQLAQNNTLRRSSPTQVGSLTDWETIFTGGKSFLATKTDGTLWACGNDDSGQLGLGVAGAVDKSSPVQVGALTNWNSASLGSSHSLALYGVV